MTHQTLAPMIHGHCLRDNGRAKEGDKLDFKHRKTMSQTMGMKEVMLRAIWGIDRFHVIDMTPTWAFQHRVLSHLYITGPLLAKLFPEGRKSHALQLSARLDNCRIHSSNA
jgi:hypothetical protein